MISEGCYIAKGSRGSVEVITAYVLWSPSSHYKPLQIVCVTMTTNMYRLSLTNTHNPSLMPSLNITDLY